MKKIGLVSGLFLLMTLITFAFTPSEFISAYNGVAPTSYQLVTIPGKNSNYTLAQNSNIQLYLVGHEILMVILDSSKMTPDQLKASIVEFNTMANYVILATQSPNSMRQAQQIFKNLQNSKTGTISMNSVTYILSADEKFYNLEIDF
ncbi:MAG: hypothetical protein NTX05_04830 [Fusobacteria bacterium]|nr:hypothetical protein [Fusobacteriota bacterium]